MIVDHCWYSDCKHRSSTALQRKANFPCIYKTSTNILRNDKQTQNNTFLVLDDHYAFLLLTNKGFKQIKNKQKKNNKF